MLHGANPGDRDPSDRPGGTFTNGAPSIDRLWVTYIVGLRRWAHRAVPTLRQRKSMCITHRRTRDLDFGHGRAASIIQTWPPSWAHDGWWDPEVRGGWSELYSQPSAASADFRTSRTNRPRSSVSNNKVAKIVIISGY